MQKAAVVLFIACPACCAAPSAQAQERLAASSVTDYVVGPQDVLTITSYDQADLSGKFTLEADGTFTYPLIGRVSAGGLTLRALEGALKKRLKGEGFFNNPQITVSVETYKSQKIFVVGEVRTPGTYPLSGDMNLVEAIARAVDAAERQRRGDHRTAKARRGRRCPTRTRRRRPNGSTCARCRTARSPATCCATATRFVPRAESVYVFGQVKNPGAYAVQQKDTSVLQALSLAGGINDRGATTRIRIVRMVAGEKKELKVKLSDLVLPGDTIIVAERIF